MTLTYIFHSGFVVEAEHCILVFDYWMDPKEVMQRFAGSTKHTYVFASHFHEDHFSRDIFGWRDGRHTYILSKDILRHRRASREEADVWVGKGATWQDENIRVTATGSNDSGVSWIIEVEGCCIFHAGDLCNWYARFLAEQDVPDEVMSTEFGRINPVAEEKRFLGELKDIARLIPKRSECPDFDLVMFPVDGRIGNGYTLGGRQFIERFRVGMFVPMHFVASGFESAWRMAAFCQERGITFWSIKEEGESITLPSTVPIFTDTDAPENARITFRPATSSDAYFIARGFHTAMLYEDTPEEQIADFARNICVREDVLYSWRNTFIAEINGTPVGMLTSYDGRFYREMRIRTMALVKEHLGVEFPGMEDEAVPGEYYLDSLAVVPSYRGKGIGSALLQKGLSEGRRLGLKVTLAVDPVNDRAKHLYESLGFRPDGMLFIFGHDYERYSITEAKKERT